MIFPSWLSYFGTKIQGGVPTAMLPRYVTSWKYLVGEGGKSRGWACLVPAPDYTSILNSTALPVIGEQILRTQIIFWSWPSNHGNGQCGRRASATTVNQENFAAIFFSWIFQISVISQIVLCSHSPNGTFCKYEWIILRLFCELVNCKISKNFL